MIRQRSLRGSKIIESLSLTEKAIYVSFSDPQIESSSDQKSRKSFLSQRNSFSFVLYIKIINFLAPDTSIHEYSIIMVLITNEQIWLNEYVVR